VIPMPESLSPDQVDALLRAAPPGAAVHLVGAGGCGVSGLGHLLLDLGFRVTGSDLVSNDETQQLVARGAQVGCGHLAEWVAAARPVVLGYSSAVGPDNPELQAAVQMGVPVVRRAVLLAALLHRQAGICVAGMHGKTTTTAWLALALQNMGLPVSWAVGGQVPQLVRAAAFSSPHVARPKPLFVIEADESDGTLGLFQPEHTILLNVDAEHLDHYTGIESVCSDFGRFANRTHGLKVYCRDDHHLERLLAGQAGSVSFGFHRQADYQVRTEERSPTQSSEQRFAIWHHGEKLGGFTTRLIGQKNLSNAGGVIALLHQLGCAPSDIARAMAPFRGVARRQQLLHADARLQVYDDYGHHPSEIRATLQAFRSLRPGRLLVAFQPHRYTRTRHLLHEFATAFQGADLLWLTDIYPASEPAIPGVSGAVLAAAVRAHGQAVEYVPTLQELGQAVLSTARAGDLVLFLGAGDITQVAHQVARQLQAESAPPRVGSAAADTSAPSPQAGQPAARKMGDGPGAAAARTNSLLGIEGLIEVARA
jgi:UDP-N-acetylmuramate--alanine ligase